MIPEGTYKYGPNFIEPGPALRRDLGTGALKDAVKPENGTFPGTVALAGVAVRVEEADASQKQDLMSILRILAGSDKDAPPPAHCQGRSSAGPLPRLRRREQGLPRALPRPRGE